MVSIVSGVDIAINPRDDPGVLIRYSIELINERKQLQYTLHQHVSFAAISTILLSKQLISRVRLTPFNLTRDYNAYLCMCVFVCVLHIYK